MKQKNTDAELCKLLLLIWECFFILILVLGRTGTLCSTFFLDLHSIVRIKGMMGVRKQGQAWDKETEKIIYGVFTDLECVKDFFEKNDIF